jgi:hypothetical protein
MRHHADSASLIIKALFVVLVIAGAIGIVCVSKTLLRGHSSVEVFCCMRQGQKCVGKYDPAQCVNDGGVAFSVDEAICEVACAPSPSPHAASATNSR